MNTPLVKNSFKNRSLVSIKDLSQADVELVLQRAEDYYHHPSSSNSLSGKIMASCFFEPSTRTRLSFEAAMQRLGGSVVGFADSGSTSVQKGESLADTMRVIGGYADLIVIRHPEVGSAKVTSSYVDIPVINAGDGTNEHPTQTLLDLFTMRHAFGRLNLNIALVGDLKHGRTVHSLIRALKYFEATLFLVSPKALALPKPLIDEIESLGIRYSYHENIDEIIGQVDLIYMTRLQAERFEKRQEYEALKSSYCLTLELLKKAKSHLKIMHPLPRLQEMGPEIDGSDHALYFQQAKNGLFVRQALLSLILE